MIKISKYFYIHPITIILFIVCFITRQLEVIMVSYVIMTIHEFSHLLAAVLIGLKPSRIVVYPFGLNLKLKNTIVNSSAEEIILYAAGPLSNIVMALVALFIKFPYSYDFYIQNIALFLFNMLPILPLDGGIIAKKIITRYIGYKKSVRIMNVISILVISVLSALCIYSSVKDNFNYTVCFLCIFLICNILITKEKYNIDFIKELIYYKENEKLYYNKKVKTMAIDNSSDYKKILYELAERYYYIFFVIDKNGSIEDILTENDIVNKVYN